MQDGRFVQERQPYQIVHSGNISFVATLDAVLQCCRIFEGKFSSAADGVDLDPQPIDGIDDRWFPDFRGVPYPDALAGLGHPTLRAVRADLQPWPIQGKLETTALPGRRPPKPAFECFSGSCASASQSPKPTIYAALWQIELTLESSS